MPAAGPGYCQVILLGQFQPLWRSDYAETTACLYFPEVHGATCVSLIIFVFVYLVKLVWNPDDLLFYTSHTIPVSSFSKCRCFQHFMWNRKCHLPFCLFVYYLTHRGYQRCEQVTCSCLTLHFLWMYISFLFSKLSDVVLIFIIHGVFSGNQS